MHRRVQLAVRPDFETVWIAESPRVDLQVGAVELRAEHRAVALHVAGDLRPRGHGRPERRVGRRLDRAAPEWVLAREGLPREGDVLTWDVVQLPELRILQPPEDGVVRPDDARVRHRPDRQEEAIALE